LRREYRTHRWARFTFWVAVSAVITRILEYSFGWPLESLWVLLLLALIVAGVYYFFRLVRIARRRLLWRLTSRLIVTYIFIAFVPVILILLITGLGAIILNGQFAAYLVHARLQNHFDELKQLNRVVAHEAVHIDTRDPGKLFDDLESFYQDDMKEYSSSYPGLGITLRAQGKARAFFLSGSPMTHPVSEPRWLKGEEWAGFVMNEGKVSLRAVDEEETKAGRLAIILSMPVSPELLNIVGEGIGPVAVFPLKFTPEKDSSIDGKKAEVDGISTESSVRSDGVALPKSRVFFDFSVHGASALNPVLWDAPKFQEQNNPVLVAVNSRIFTLNEELLGTLGKFSSAPVVVFLVLGAIFLQIELFALVTGVLLTRSITSTVNRLQAATERVKAGDFSHRIDLPAHDQVSALGAAFDTMTASVERLMAESREKLRLESELNIAREVQKQLFPQTAPALPGARMFGECRPARGVSGDYYDFLKLGPGSVGLVLGDVSGKGIYAALLMAGIQSAVRTQLYDGTIHEGGAGTNYRLPLSSAALLGRLNRQVFENTPDSKYATFFYAIYDAARCTLEYANAGHPPPFLFHRKGVSRLDAGGTVLGIFPRVDYQQDVVQLEPGDVVIAYTDGLVEPENSYGEEFGEARLIKLIREAIDSPPEVLAESIYSGVMDWTGGGELQDDMTLLYLKATG
ncbi:MAG: SpoIIE family protein phosphatase, partial [Acidobacteriota bacterium]|nr:SpoIIE family protein phosphatase [Acidobacteriota bacterium]